MWIVVTKLVFRACRCWLIINAFIVALVWLELLVKLINSLAQLGYLFNQALVLVHNAHMFFLLNKCFLFETLSKWVIWWLKILLLILIFLYDVRIDFSVFLFLVLHIEKQFIVDVMLEHIIVINVPWNFIYRSFEFFDIHVIFANLRSWFLDKFNHLFLSRTQIINKITQISIYLIEFL